MIKRKILTLAITILITISIPTIISSAKQNNDIKWITLPGSFRLTPAFPDKCSTYKVLNFKPKTGDYDILKIHGEFPHARYFSFTIYDSDEGTDVVAFLDKEIQPDPGSINPYMIGADRNAKNRNYTIWITKEGITPPNKNNSITIPTDIETLILGMRIYRPDEGTDTLGDAPLPEIEFLKADLTPGINPQVGLSKSETLTKISMFFLNKELI